MKIYMIRHGETDWNKKRKLQVNIFDEYIAAKILNKILAN